MLACSLAVLWLLVGDRGWLRNGSIQWGHVKNVGSRGTFFILCLGALECTGDGKIGWRRKDDLRVFGVKRGVVS